MTEALGIISGTQTDLIYLWLPCTLRDKQRWADSSMGVKNEKNVVKIVKTVGISCQFGI